MFKLPEGVFDTLVNLRELTLQGWHSIIDEWFGVGTWSMAMWKDGYLRVCSLCEGINAQFAYVQTLMLESGILAVAADGRNKIGPRCNQIDFPAGLTREARDSNNIFQPRTQERFCTLEVQAKLVHE